MKLLNLKIDRVNRWRTVALSCLIAAFSNVGSQAIAQAQTPPAANEFHQDYDLAANGIVNVSNTNGEIRVSSWQENRVRVDAYKRGQEGELGRIEIRVTAAPGRLEIKTVFPESKGDRARVDYVLTVPATAQLNSLSTNSGAIVVTGPVAAVTARALSGEVSLSDVAGAVIVSAHSGNVTLNRIGGDSRVTTTSGAISLTQVAGEIRAQATSGNIKVEKAARGAIINSLNGQIEAHGVEGDLKAEALSGRLDLSNVGGYVNANSISGAILLRQARNGARLTGVNTQIKVENLKGRLDVGTTGGEIVLTQIESHAVNVKCVNGLIHFAGKLHDDGIYSFDSFNGEVVLNLPAESGFRLTARTHSGIVKTDFPIQLESFSTAENRGLTAGRAGQGGADLRVTSFSGNISLKKAN